MAEPGAEQAQQHYFTARPATDAAARQVTLRDAGQTITLASAAGVFSAGHLDAGTKILLDTVPPPRPDSVVLDLGTGYGPIACVLGLRQPSVTVWAVDVNERALALARQNAVDLQLPGVRPALPAEVPDEVRFDAVYSNPPIRVGKAVLHEMLSSWLGRLRPGGHAYLVVHKHLGSDSLQRWLIEQRYPTTRLTSVRGFRVLDVRAPDQPARDA
ncbi:MAG TPA: methyltransferase [Jatrophihabitans sp.]|nr:methyltransferase [Jatrophihabitans sp.]